MTRRLTATLLLWLSCCASAQAVDWTPTVPVGRGENAPTSVVVAGAGPGTAIMAWNDQASMSQGTLRATVRSGGVTAASVALAAQSITPTGIAAAPDGQAAVVGRTTAGSDAVAVSRDADGTWSAPVTLATTVTENLPVRVAMNAGGVAAAVWTRFDGAYQRVEASFHAPGQGWTPAVRISDAVINGASPDLAVLPDGRVLAVFTEDVSGDDLLLSSTRGPDGSWSLPEPIIADPIASTPPALASSPSGRVLVVWLSKPDMAGKEAVRAVQRDGDAWGALETVRVGQPSLSPFLAPAVDDSGRVAVGIGGEGGDQRLEVRTRAADGTWPLTGATDRTSGGGALVAPPGRPLTALWSDIDAQQFRAAPVTQTLNAGTMVDQPFAASLGVDPAGDSLLGIVTGTTPANLALGLRVLDGTPPALALGGATTASAGTSARLTAQATDAWSPIAGIAWNFGDGATAGGTSVDHTWAAPGTYAVSATATDAAGNSAVATGTVTVSAATAVPTPQPPRGTDRSAPVLGALRVSGRRSGVTVRLRLSEAATVTARLERRRGRRWKRVGGSVGARLAAGKGQLRVKRRLSPGRYRLTLVAADAAGNRSAPKRLTFTIKRR